MAENPMALQTKGSSKKAAPQDEGALLFRAKNADHDAFNALLTRYQRMLTSLSRSFSVPESEREDLYQEGLIGFYKAVLLYDSSVAAFSTFSYLCARRHMLSALKAWAKRGAGTVPLELVASEPAALCLSPDDQIIDRESCAQLLSQCDRALSEYESAVLKLVLSGKSVQKIAVSLSKSPKSVSNALSRARQKLSVILPH